MFGFKKIAMPKAPALPGRGNAIRTASGISSIVAR